MVWSPLVRALHWTLAIAVLLNYFYFEEGETAHRYSGYLAAAVVAIRIGYGFLALDAYTPFRHWFPTLTRIKAFFRGEHRTLGHNPLAALMILWLMFLVLASGVSGWMMTLDRFFGEEWLEDAHELLGDVLVWSALVHAAAAVVTSILEKRNRVAAMIHGRL